MLQCLILGSSFIINGLHQYKPDCTVYSKPGTNTSVWNKTYLNNDLSANVVVIILGAGDAPRIPTRDNLNALRNKVNAKHVYWVLPLEVSHVTPIILTIALENNDKVIEIKEKYVNTKVLSVEQLTPRKSIITQQYPTGRHINSWPTDKVYKEIAEVISN